MMRVSALIITAATAAVTLAAPARAEYPDHPVRYVLHVSLLHGVVRNRLSFAKNPAIQLENGVVILAAGVFLLPPVRMKPKGDPVNGSDRRQKA
jgi:hypothetical protein